MRKVAIFLWILLPALPCLAQTPADLFNDEVLQEIRLDVHPKDWDRLKANFLENTYYPADMRWLYNGRYIETPQVAIRSRGTGSRNPVKPGLRVDINRYSSEHRFLGLRELTLRNNTQDATMLKERIAFALMRKLGLPAPRLAHARLYVNDEYMGLYTIVESINEDFLQDRFKDANGYLYEYDYGFNDPPYFFEYRGDDPASYSPKPFKPETQENHPEIERIVSMVRAINLTSDEEFASAIAEYLDLKTFAVELAAEAYIAELDGIIGDYGLNNFYLYRQSTSNRFMFLPWDKSETFTAVDRPPLMNLETNRLARRALAVPEVEKAFRDALAAAVSTSGGTEGWLEQEILRAYDQISTAARQDPYKQCTSPATQVFGLCSNEDFESAVAEMILFVRGRYIVIRQELARTSAPTLPTGEQSFEVNTGEATIFATSNTSNEVRSGHGYLETSPDSAPVSGLAVLSYKREGIIVSETAFAASRPLRSGRFNVEIEPFMSTAVAFSNPNTKPVAVTFYFTDENGQDFGHGNTALAPGTQVAGFLDEQRFDVPAPFHGTFTFTASLPVGALALGGFINERSEFLLSALPIGDVFDSGPTASVIPYVASGGEWTAEVRLVNQEDFAIEGNLLLHGSGDVQQYPYAIPSHSSVQISLENTAQKREGWVEISSDGRLPTADALLSFRREGVLVAQTVVTAIPERTTLRTYGEVSTVWESSLALVNNSAGDATVQIEVSGEGVESTAKPASIVVPARGQIVTALTEIPGLQPRFAGFQGVISISSSVPIHGLAFGSHTNARGDTLLTALPPGEDTSDGFLSIPHMVDSAGYETRIILIGSTSEQGTDGVLRYRNADGELVDLGLR